MKQKFTKLMGGVFLSFLFTANTANAQTTLASWDFTKVYSVASTEGAKSYFSASDETVTAKSDETNFATATPYFYPVSQVGSQSDYTLSGGGSSWIINTPYNAADYCLQIKNNPVNSLDNVTDAATHKSYYEISFPATGYKDIKLSFTLSYTDNETAPVVYLVSTDGGTTWAKAGEVASTGSWFTINSHNDKSLAVANLSNVKVRILGKGAQSSKYWGIKNLTITGTAITSETFSAISAVADDDAHGTVTIDPVGGSYENGTSVTVSATNKLGWKFQEWQKGGVKVSEDNPYTFTVSDNTALTAVFAANTTYTLATSYSPAGIGTVTRSSYQDAYDENSSITLTATPNTGYAFVEWQDGSGNTLSTDNPYTFNIMANTTAVAIFKLSPVTDNTEVTVASWTFSTGYDADGLLYTPNNDEWAAIAQAQSKNNNNPKFIANGGYKALTGYVATISNDDTGNTYYSVKDNNGDKILSLFPNKISNDVSDYTDASQHKVYAQFSFSTLGLKDVKFAPTFTYGSNAERNLQLVYSVDGGNTWTDGGACAGGPNWYTYNTTTINLNANNAENVIVRLLPANGEDGDYRINSVTVTATVAPRSVKVTDAGYATYYNDCAVEIPTGLTAYWGKLSHDQTKVELTEITDGIIPAETAVVVKGEAKTYNLTATAETGSTYASNALRGVVANTSVSSLELGTGTLYVLGKTTGGQAAFCKYTGTTLGDHRAYLFVAGAAARELTFSFGETTGIEAVGTQTAKQQGDIYNLAGQRVSQPTKGLYIVGGKKVVVK